jgi:hypothetical protein
MDVYAAFFDIVFIAHIPRTYLRPDFYKDKLFVDLKKNNKGMCHRQTLYYTGPKDSQMWSNVFISQQSLHGLPLKYLSFIHLKFVRI